MTLDEATFNYGELNDNHKDAAKEILNLLQEYKDPLVVEEMIKKYFELTPKPKYDHSQSPFLKACADVGLPANLQGWVEDDGTLYPLFVMSGDIRLLDKFVYKVQSDK